MSNHAAQGTQAEDPGQAVDVFQQNITTSSKSMILTGYNDMRLWGTSTANGLDTYEGTLRAMLVWLATPTAKKIYAHSSGVTTSPSNAWTDMNTSLYPINIGKYTNTLQATATANKVYGTVIYVTSIKLNSGGGTFTVKVDGVDKGTFSCSDAQTTAGGMFYAPFVARVGGLGDGFHTVEVRHTASGYVYLLSISGNVGLTTKTGPEVWVGNCLLMQAYDNAGSDAAAGKYNTIIRKVVRELAGDGLNVGFADAAAYFDPATMMGSDGVHPNVTGQQSIADTFLYAMDTEVHAADRLKP